MNRYFQFLCNIVGNANSHQLLLRQLHRIEFYSFVPNDDNREEDGKKLREIFLDETGLRFIPPKEKRSHTGSSSLREDRESVPYGPCTILEMLIGLSYRMENELEGGPSPIKADECFWILIKNLNLDWCDDNAYYQEAGNEAIEDIVGEMLDRKYDRKGNGGLFPLVRTNKDQRKVEIWYQMQEYLLEKYEF